MNLRLLIVVLCVSFAQSGYAQIQLQYAPAPPDNPLKGLVPYARPHADRFPHSMEYSSLPLSKLVVGRERYDWQPLEQLLDDIAGRRKQTVLRIWMEYPGHDDGIPKYLEAEGLEVVEWLNTNTDPFPRQKVRTPDYSDPRLREALKKFILDFGERYDGDPRLGYITAGILGTWGEWHTYPRTDLMASKEVQLEVMDAYEAAFTKTPVLLRYPAGANNYDYADNAKRRFGYHDDSFAWATLDTGRKEDNWFFVPALRDAQALEKWKQFPIGGEIRPELWGMIFDEKPDHPQAQDFADCVRTTHATWQLDTGMFREKQSPERIGRAIRQVQQMGYEFHVASADAKRHEGSLTATAFVENRGVAPFYHDWSIEIGLFDESKKHQHSLTTDWTLTGILPAAKSHWTKSISLDNVPEDVTTMAIRVVNPMEDGLPLYFANEAADQLGDGWLRLDRIVD